ncbi:MAG: hypothetical protein GF375_04070 [Candidatus Omnitrophica bacterium]|nr:hypothetical protein [Candidatus Omnitrophota bacterium]
MAARAYPELVVPRELARYRADVNLSGAIPVVADVTAAGWSAGDRGFGIGTDGSVWWMYFDGAALEAVEHTE